VLVFIMSAPAVQIGFPWPRIASGLRLNYQWVMLPLRSEGPVYGAFTTEVAFLRIL